MGRSAKKPKFEAFSEFSNCFGPNQSDDRHWQDYIKTSPLVLEVGSGKASFLLEQAKDKSRNFIGTDLKADRLYSAAKKALEGKLENIAFIQTNAQDFSEYIDDKSVDEIWVTFPDPYPKDRHAKRRLVGEKFLEIYHKLLIPEGRLHFKTDDKVLFEWGTEEIKRTRYFDISFQTNDLHAEPNLEVAKIMTNYERKFVAKGLKINYLSASSVGR